MFGLLSCYQTYLLLSDDKRYMVAEVGWPVCAYNLPSCSTLSSQTSGLAGSVGLSRTGLPPDRQVCTLLYCMGEEAGDVLITAKIKEANRQKYDKVIDKFDGFFKVR